MSLPYIRGILKETFDTYETEGLGSEVLPLIQIDAQKDNLWISNLVFPMIYELYGSDLKLERNPDLLGIFPSRAIFVENISAGSYLLSGKQDGAKQGDFFFKYLVPRYVHNDYYELLNKAAAKYLNKSPSPQAQRLLAGQLTDTSIGTYTTTIKYQLPGTKITTWSENMIFKFEYANH
jgi:hypothetical protein